MSIKETGLTQMSVSAQTHVCTYCCMVWDFFYRTVLEWRKNLL